MTEIRRPVPPQEPPPDEWDTSSAMRRRARRASIRFALRVRRHGGDWEQAEALNISLTGALIAAQKPIAANQAIEIEIKPPGSDAPPTIIRSTVVRIASEREDNALGVRFESDLGAESTNLIARLLEAEFNLGNYELRSLIATGGMAEIYLARALHGPAAGDLVALKRIRAEQASDPTIVALIQREAKIMMSLDHPGIVKLLEVKTDRDSCYMAMEHVDGATADQLVTAANEQNQHLPVHIACFIAREIARTLQHVHEARDENGELLGLVHRDVTPPNILLSRQGDVRLADFGVVQISLRPSAGIDDDEVVVGTRGFIAPEAVLGTGVKGSADIFALGATLFRMLTGVDAFQGVSDAQVFRRTVDGKHKLPSKLRPGIPPELDRILASALSNRRASGADDRLADKILRLFGGGKPQRFATANDMADALDPLVTDDCTAELAELVNRLCPPRTERRGARDAAPDQGD